MMLIARLTNVSRCPADVCLGHAGAHAQVFAGLPYALTPRPGRAMRLPTLALGFAHTSSPSNGRCGSRRAEMPTAFVVKR